MIWLAMGVVADVVLAVLIGRRLRRQRGKHA